jgi:hypothetical protein
MIMKRANTNKACYVCRKTPLSKDEIGLTKKLIGKDVQKFYCLDCFADYLEVTTEELIAKIEEFKEEDCILFR